MSLARYKNAFAISSGLPIFFIGIACTAPSFTLSDNLSVISVSIIPGAMALTVIFLDASSTAVAIAKAIKGVKNITVITNSLQIAIELIEEPNCKVISTGGVAIESSFALVGQVTDRTISSYFADKAIISSKGFDLEKGFTDSDERHATNKKSMLKGARTKITLACTECKQRNYNLKKHMVRLAVYELTKLIAPNNVSAVRMRDYEDSMKWLNDAAKLRLNPQIPRKVDETKKPVTDWQLATFQNDYDPYRNPWMV